MERAIIDTNVFVAAGFNPRSASARLLDRVRAGGLTLVWNRATRDETRAVLGRIPRLDWHQVADLFRQAGRFGAETDPASAGFVADPSDRKFAALSLASGAPIVSSDEDLLVHAGRLAVRTPAAWERARRLTERARE